MYNACNALTARWASTIDDRSTVLAGAGVFPLLALLAGVADGAAREELYRVVGSADFAFPDSAATSLAVGAWTSAALPLTESWTATVPPSLRGVLTGDIAADQAALDRWAATQTGGLIPRMPVTLTVEVLMVLASALCVTTRWQRPFLDGRLAPASGPWAGRSLGGLELRTPEVDRVCVADTPAGALTLLTVPGADDVDVVLALGPPDSSAGETLGAALGALSASSLPGSDLALGSPGPGLVVEDVPSPTSEPQLAVSTVRFTVEATHDLLDDPALFGLAAATDPSRAHFPGISPRPLAVSQARQSAVASFSAVGFKAAAVTAVAMSLSAVLPSTTRRLVRVSFDRPFGFVAVHRPTGLVLVAGWVADPAEHQYAE